MKTNRLFTMVAGCFLIASAASSLSQGTNATEKWVPLFNGKDLTGWTPKFKGSPAGENYRNTFRVADGVLRADYSEYSRFNGEFGHLFWNEKLSNYRLRVEYRFIGEQAQGGPSWAFRNSGIMIHSEAPGSMDKDQEFPVSIEVQLLGGSGSGTRTTANLCTPGTHIVMDGKLVTQHCTTSKSKTYHGDQWVTVELEVRGNKLVRHIVEGETVMSYSEPQLDESDAHARKLLAESGKMLNEGYLSVQAESHPTEFRKIELLKLED